MNEESRRAFEEFERKINAIPDELKFPPLTDKFSEGARNVSSWLIGYLSNREGVGNNIDSKQYLENIGQNSSLLASRFRGSLLGLAIGDALGTTLEFSQRDSLPAVTDIVGGGPFKLKPGEWTDDTSMAICLAHSLIRKEYSNPKDQMDLYMLWWQKGVFSSNGRCFDIGNTVMDALARYQTTGQANSGSTDPMSAGNGSLMRLAPVALFYFSNIDECVKQCGSSSLTTHGAKEAVDSCRYFGALLHGAIRGESKAALVDKLYEPRLGFWDENPLAPSIINVANNIKGKTRNEIKSTGYVVDSLEAAIWAFRNSNSFEEGMILAVNLAGDADTIGAIYGQLAGAFYGEYQITPRWIRKLSYFHVFYLYAEKLLRFGVCDMQLRSNPSLLRHI